MADLGDILTLKLQQALNRRMYERGYVNRDTRDSAHAILSASLQKAGRFDIME